MKRIFTTLVLAFAVAATGWAQYQVTNSGFETFEADALNGTGSRPTGWNASNVRRTVMGVTATGDMVFEEAAGRTGKCVRLVNTEVGAAGITENAPAWVTLGKPWNYLSGLNTGSATAGTDGGIAFTYRPDTVSVWIKRTFAGSARENAHIVFYSWKGTSRADSYKAKGGGCSSTTHYDEESDIRQVMDKNDCGTAELATQIADAQWRDNNAYNDWTEIRVPITYYSNERPEKMNIIFSAANYPNHRDNNVLKSSQLYVDDMRLVYSSKVHEILLNNRPMMGVSPDKTLYSYALGATATQVPVITLKRSGRLLDPQEYTINYGAIGEATTITVRAEDGSSTTTYTVNFVGVVSSNPRPADITVNGASIPGFQQYLYNYTLELPYGTTAVPAVSVVPAEDGQTFVVSNPASLPGQAVVTVTAPDEVTKQTYTINYTVGALNDNTLTDIRVNGRTITGFAPTKNNYVVELPVGTTADPVIEYTTAYPSEHQIVVDNRGLAGGATIKVTPRGTTNTRTYSLRFVITASTYSYLQSISIGGAPLEGFDPETLSYQVTLPLGTTQMPAISWVAGDEYQNVVIDNGGLDGVTKITVTAQSGAVSIYRLQFATLKSDVSTLSDIKINGESLQGFDPGTTSYNVALGVGADKPVISWVAGDEYQTITFTDGGLAGTSRIVVKAGDGTTTTYTIRFTVSQSSLSTLLDIKVGGVSVAGFAPEVTTYDVLLPRGTTVLPDITWTAGDAYQTVRKVEGGVNGETKITVKSQSGATTVYTLRFSVETNSNVRLLDLRVGDATIEGFDAEVLDYEYQLAAGTTELPSISYTKADEGQTVMVTRGGVNGVTQIVVVAEDRTQRTYTITFSVAKSESALLEMIYLDGAALAGFDAQQFAYEYTLSASDTACPVVTVDKGAGQSVKIITPRVEGVVRIEVVPEAGARNVYTIDVRYPRSSNAALAGISVGGVALSGFAPDIYTYSVVLEQGAAALPSIEYTKGDSLQKVVVERNGVDGVTTIAVMAESGAVARYELHFSVSKSASSELASITIDGNAIEGFAADKHDYIYYIAYEAVAAPVLGYVRGDAGQRVEMTVPAAEGRAEIAVESEDGSSRATYTVDIVRTLPDNTDLSAVKVDGVAIPMSEFVESQSDAVDGAVPHRVLTATVDRMSFAAAPVVSCEASDASQSVIESHAGLNGSQIIVAAANGDICEYVVRYNIVAGSDAALRDIRLATSANNHYQLPGFNADTTDYVVVLPWRTRVVPVVTPYASHRGGVATVDYRGVNDTTTISVVSEDGTSSRQYRIFFEVEKSDVTTLAGIYVGGVMVAGFEAGTESYNVRLPYGTVSLPAITWDLAMADDGTVIEEQQVVLSHGSLADTVSLEVIAENGESRTYTLLFTVDLSPKANELLVMSVGDQSVAVESGKTDYALELPVGTTEVPAISYTKSFAEQQVEAVVTGGVNGMAELRVAAPGKDTTVYTIDLSVRKTDLIISSLKIDGVPFERFDPDQHTYIIPVSQRPVIDVAVPAGIIGEFKANTEKMAVISLFSADGDGTETNDYTFYYYYTADQIPNNHFQEWEDAIYNASRGAKSPVDWMVPADCAGSKWFLFTGTFYTGEECERMEEEGEVFMKLKTVSNSTLYGLLPGMATIGSMSVELGTATGTKSSVGGGIQFRNTPDNVLMEYNPVYRHQDIPNMRFLINSSALDAASQEVFTDADFNNTWKVMNKPLVWNADQIDDHTIMNITINSCHIENASQSGGGLTDSKWNSILYVRSVDFAYNNLLSSIKVDGADIEGFDPHTATYDVVVDTNSFVPEVVVEGQVADQEHHISVSPFVGGAAEATIVVVGEDGGERTYTLNITKPLSTDNALASLSVGGAALSDFDKERLAYSVSVPYGFQRQDVTAVAANAGAEVAVVSSDSSVVVTVTAESGDVREYVVRYEAAAPSSSALLASMAVADASVVFDPEQTTYMVGLASGAAIPSVSFEKAESGQTVTLTAATPASMRTTLEVVAEDGATARTYTVEFDRAPVAPSDEMLEVAVGGSAVEGFASDRYDYTIATPEDNSLYFVSRSSADRVSTTLAHEYIAISYNGKSDKVYTINFVTPRFSTAQLEALTIDGDTPTEFSPAAEEYYREVADIAPLRVAAVAADLAEMAMSYADTANRTVRYDIKSEDGSATRTVTVEFAGTVSAVDTLAGIRLNGLPLVVDGAGYTSSAAFSALTTDYSITLHSATPKLSQPALPDVDVVLAEAHQTVTIERGQTTYITVTAESGAERVYTLDFSNERSADTTLSAIFLDMVPLASFSPATRTYSYDVTDAGRQIDVRYEKADPFQTVEVEASEEQIVIVVTAESGATSQYLIELNVVRSSDVSLGSILSDGVEIEGFDADRHDYSFTLPVGTTQLPQITVVAGQNGQHIEITEGGVNGTTTIHVVAENGKDSADYRLHYTRLLSENASLAMIYVDGEELDTAGTGYTSSSAFSAGTKSYNITLPVGTRRLPLISWLEGDVYQTITSSADDEGTVTIHVVAEDTAVMSDYVVSFDTLRSHNADLAAIFVDNEPLAGFAAGIKEYTVDLPIGTTAVPEISWTMGDEWQSVVFTPAADVNGTATIAVLAEDGATASTYTIHFNRLLSDVSSLGSILVAGEVVGGFNADTLLYEITLPVGTMQLPEVTVELGDSYQSVAIVSVADTVVITVTAENGAEREYRVVFTIEKSTNAHLSMIEVNGEAVNGFDIDITTYEVVLPYGTTEVPVVTYTAAEPQWQTITYTAAETLADTAVIHVVAQDGETSLTYMVAFVVAKSDNAQLAAIYIGGELITTEAAGFEADAAFSPDLYNYNILLPYGTDSMPEITWVGQVDDYASIEFKENGIHGAASITVVSEDEMAVNEYVLRFDVKKSDNATLAMLQVGEGLIEDFQPNTFDYTVVFPIGTDTASLPTASDVVYEKMLEVQEVDVAQSSPTEIVVTVTAEDGVTVNVYVIHFEIELSGNSLLSDIRIDGVSLEGFSPTQFEYTYMLYPGALVPAMEGVKSEASQTVVVSMGNINEYSYIYVDAEDGSTSEYKVMFATTDINPGERPSKGDVSWTPLGDGNFQASSTRDNVRVNIYSTSGLLVRSEPVGLVDPNHDISGPHDGGTILHFEREGSVYIYVFVYDGNIITSGKFVR